MVFPIIPPEQDLNENNALQLIRMNQAEFFAAVMTQEFLQPENVEEVNRDGFKVADGATESGEDFHSNDAHTQHGDTGEDHNQMVHSNQPHGDTWPHSDSGHSNTTHSNDSGHSNTSHNNNHSDRNPHSNSSHSNHGNHNNKHNDGTKHSQSHNQDSNTHYNESGHSNHTDSHKHYDGTHSQGHWDRHNDDDHVNSPAHADKHYASYPHSNFGHSNKSHSNSPGHNNNYHSNDHTDRNPHSNDPHSNSNPHSNNHSNHSNHSDDPNTHDQMAHTDTHADNEQSTHDDIELTIGETTMDLQIAGDDRIEVNTSNNVYVPSTYEGVLTVIDITNEEGSGIDDVEMKGYVRIKNLETGNYETGWESLTWSNGSTSCVIQPQDSWETGFVLLDRDEHDLPDDGMVEIQIKIEEYVVGTNCTEHIRDIERMLEMDINIGVRRIQITK